MLAVSLSNALTEQILRDSGNQNHLLAEQNLQEKALALFEIMRTQLGTLPATGDWISVDNNEYYISARTIFEVGKSGHPEIWIAIDLPLGAVSLEQNN